MHIKDLNINLNFKFKKKTYYPKTFLGDIKRLFFRIPRMNGEC
jgi:hypothetical protein